MAVDAPVESSDQAVDRNLKDAADTERCYHRNGASRFNLLPVTRGESKRNHIFMAVAALSAQATDSLTQHAKKLRLIYHA
jgi:hypothetical protein